MFIYMIPAAPKDFPPYTDIKLFKVKMMITPAALVSLSLIHIYLNERTILPPLLPDAFMLHIWQVMLV